ncbi:hypothetical protein A4V08_23835 [Lachnoclostridium sp. YL32]|nr:hypothetical protein A4V08_23835 [Lachnoclostridium sp. YL32]
MAEAADCLAETVISWAGCLANTKIYRSNERIENHKRRSTIMKAKKWISMIAAGAMAISMLAGCGASNTASARNEETQTAESVAETEKTPEETVTAAESEGSEREETQDGRILVVYYSASGHTEDVANTIAGATGADLFELEPAEPYSSADLNYSDDISRVSQEHENEALRDVELAAATVEDWDSYETVFIGYPKMEQPFYCV